MLLRISPLERLLHRLHLLPTPIMDAFASVLFGRVLVIAVRRGLFDALASGPLSESQIASRTHLYPQALSLLLESCVLGGYLGQRRDLYYLTAEGRKWLCTDSPASLINLLAYFEMLHGHWTDLEVSLEQGAPRRPYYESYGESEWRTYALGMRDLAKLLLPRVIARITPAKHARKLLDIGGSHGLYSIECCRRRPDLTATIMDFAPALAQTSRFAEEAGVADRVAYRAGNFLAEPLPPEQDVVLMFNIIHGLSEGQNRALVARALAALRPGGKLFILDQIRGGSSWSSPLARSIPLMVGINLMNEVGGTVYSVSEVEGWCDGRGARSLGVRLPGVGLLEIVC